MDPVSRCIISINFKIRRVSDGVINRFSGLSIRSLLYNRILGLILDPEYLHRYKGLKPISITPIYELDEDKIRVYSRGSDVPHGFFRINLLDIEDPAKIINSLSSLDTLNIDGIRYQVISINFILRSYETVFSWRKKLRRFKLKFLTPTMTRRPQHYISIMKDNGRFRAKIKKKHSRPGIYIPLPQPNLIFKSILRQLTNFSGYKDFPFEGIKEFIDDDGVVIAGFPRGIRSRIVKVGGGERYIGFVGEVVFEVDTSSVYSEYIYTLARYAEYSNVGAGRTAGFGWVSFEELE
jgi:CRISPR/Cas system endoribonuclease Cas6 (RAMP superfamily)